MGKTTKIPWTQATWNPVTGCNYVSAGCNHCYAESMSRRFRWTTKPWTQENAAENVVCHLDRVNDPLRWRDPKMVFVVSMGDLFHPQVPDEFIWQVWGTMALAHWHTFQVLTKRPERMASLVERFYSDDAYGTVLKATNALIPLPNVWVGVTAENQQEADRRIPWLLKTPAAVRFVSAEPLLGSVYVLPYLTARPIPEVYVPGVDAPPFDRKVDWVIIGGESGRGARPMEDNWAIELVAQCRLANIPVFVKQLGGWPDKRAGDKALVLGRTYKEMPERVS